MNDRVVDGPADAPAAVLLAHGANQPMDSPFMTYFARGLAAAGLRVVRFEFPYMERRRRTGAKAPPDKAVVLERTWRDVADEHGDRPFVMGGKSMGGRAAAPLADALGASGLLVLGYPFHPAGRPAEAPRRAQPLSALETPALICQGERDSMGGRSTVSDLGLSAAVRLHWLPDGDHSFTPRKKSGHTEADNLESALWAGIRFVRRVTGLDADSVAAD